VSRHHIRFLENPMKLGNYRRAPRGIGQFA
jgi:hypothetical protein